MNARNAALPAIIWIYLIAILLPIELSAFIGPIFITPTRFLFLVSSLPLVILLFQSGRANLLDGLIFFYIIWAGVSIFSKQGIGGLETVGQTFLDVVTPYLISRLFLTRVEQLERLLGIICCLIAILALLSIPEALWHQRFLHDLPQAITGVAYEMQNDVRLGLLRAASTFENPILFGLYCATFFSLIWYTSYSLKTRVILCLSIVLGTVCALSSAPLLLIVIQIFLIFLERITRGISARLPIALSVIVICVIAIELVSNRGVAQLIAGHLTFNPHTGYYRLLQWDHTIDDVLANPLFGFRIEEWTKPFWMTNSIDNFWLLTAVKYGFPGVSTLFIILGLIFFKLYQRRRSFDDPDLSLAITGWMICITSFFLGAWTVDLFGKMLPTLFFLTGIGVAISQMESSKPKFPGENVQSTPSRRSAYTRFSEVEAGKNTIVKNRRFDHVN